MATKCYAQVRGSALRVTSLDSCGTVPDPIPYAVSRSVSSVVIDEVVESGNHDLIKNEEGEGRLLLVRTPQLIRYTADIRFLKVDPGILSLVAGVEVVHGYDNDAGFGYGPFGETGFGGHGDIVGFDAKTRLPAKAYALEVWSRLESSTCDGQRQYGYTLFPYLMGGVLTGFVFENGLVSFTVRGAQTRRGARWEYGPHDIMSGEGGYWDIEGWDTDGWDAESYGLRQFLPVGQGVHWRQMVVDLAPPPETCGVQTLYDVIDNGNAADPGSGFLDGGSASYTTSDVVSGNFAG